LWGWLALVERNQPARTARLNFFDCGKFQNGVLFVAFVGDTTNRHFFSRGLMTHGGEYMKQREKYQSLAGYFSGHSERDKVSPFPRDFVVSRK
jgi:hypothetical protein